MQTWLRLSIVKIQTMPKDQKKKPKKMKDGGLVGGGRQARQDRQRF